MILQCSPIKATEKHNIPCSTIQYLPLMLRYLQMMQKLSDQSQRAEKQSCKIKTNELFDEVDNQFGSTNWEMSNNVFYIYAYLPLSANVPPPPARPPPASVPMTDGDVILSRTAVRCKCSVLKLTSSKYYGANVHCKSKKQSFHCCWFHTIQETLKSLQFC